MRLPVVVVVVLAMLGCCSLLPVSRGHNITKILAQHPEFSTFNHYLTTTRLASVINRRLTITILAVDNSGMAALLAKGLSISTLHNVLSLHVLVDYYGAKKLHQLTGGTALSSSMFQATGAAPGTTGFVNITDHRAGKVSFAAEDAGDGTSPATFVKSVKEIPYNISIIQISTILSSPEAEAPAAAPAPVNLTELMTKKGCKLFAGLLLTHPDVQKTFDDNLAGGLTVLCPSDKAVTAFSPKYKNLTADERSSLLLYHGVPVYSSIQALKDNNGVVNTLATDGAAKGYNFTVQDDGEVVTIETRITTAKITGTLVDEEPVAVYSIDRVLEPRELFKVKEAPALAPAAPAPKGTKVASEPAPAGPDESPADQKAADDNAGGRIGGGFGWIVVMAAAAVMIL